MCLMSVSDEKNEKIKAKYAGIICRRMTVGPDTGKLYFEILYCLSDSDGWKTGFGSYEPYYVLNWLEEEFEAGYKSIESATNELLDKAEEVEAENIVLRRMQPVKIDGDVLELAIEVSELRNKLKEAENKLSMYTSGQNVDNKLAEAEKEGRCLVLKDITVSDLQQMLSVLASTSYGDEKETYTTGYRNGHRNGQIEILRHLLGVYEGCSIAKETK